MNKIFETIAEVFTKVFNFLSGPGQDLLFSTIDLVEEIPTWLYVYGSISLLLLVLGLTVFISDTIDYVEDMRNGCTSADKEKEDVKNLFGKISLAVLTVIALLPVIVSVIWIAVLSLITFLPTVILVLIVFKIFYDIVKIPFYPFVYYGTKKGYRISFIKYMKNY